MPLKSHTMGTKESWREALDRIIECPLCREYNGQSDTVGMAIGWTNYGQGPEPCSCNPWAFKYVPLKAVIEQDKERRLNTAEITAAYVEAEYQDMETKRILKEKEDDA